MLLISRRLPIFTKNTGTAKGVGAFAARFLEPDEFIAEYAGGATLIVQLSSCACDVPMTHMGL
eukprot:SAG31_NODE_496_length_14862_cov_9.280837_4_plen_63_part_00